MRVEKKKKKNSLILFLFSSTIVIKSGYFHMVGGFHASDGFSVLMEPPSQIFFYLTLINQYCIMKRLICLCFCTFICDTDSVDLNHGSHRMNRKQTANYYKNAFNVPQLLFLTRQNLSSSYPNTATCA